MHGRSAGLKEAASVLKSSKSSLAFCRNGASNWGREMLRPSGPFPGVGSCKRKEGEAEAGIPGSPVSLRGIFFYFFVFLFFTKPRYALHLVPYVINPKILVELSSRGGKQ